MRRRVYVRKSHGDQKITLWPSPVSNNDLWMRVEADRDSRGGRKSQTVSIDRRQARALGRALLKWGEGDA